MALREVSLDEILAPPQSAPSTLREVSLDEVLGMGAAPAPPAPHVGVPENGAQQPGFRQSLDDAIRRLEGTAGDGELGGFGADQPPVVVAPLGGDDLQVASPAQQVGVPEAGQSPLPSTPPAEGWQAERDDVWAGIQASAEAAAREAESQGLSTYAYNLKRGAELEQDSRGPITGSSPYRVLEGAARSFVDVAADPLLAVEAKLGIPGAEEVLDNRRASKDAESLRGKPWLESIVSGAVNSVTQTTTRGVMGGLPAILAGAGYDSYNDTYRSELMKGKTQDEAEKSAMASAALEVGVTGVFNIVGLGGLEKILTSRIKGDVAKEIVKQTVAELTEEEIITLGQNLATQASAGEAQDYWDTAAQTVLTMGLGTGLNRLADAATRTEPPRKRRLGDPPHEDVAVADQIMQPIPGTVQEVEIEDVQPATEPLPIPSEQLEQPRKRKLGEPPTGERSPVEPAPQDPQTQEEYDRQYGPPPERMLSPGEVTETSSGRQTTPFPKFDFGTNRKATNSVARVDKWLAENAIAEAEARGDDFNATIFRGETSKPGSFPQATRDAMNEYLFGEQPPVVPSILKPLTPPTNPVVEPQTEQQETKYKYASTQVNLPPEVADSVISLGARIPESELAADGRETEPHITVKYGLESDDAVGKVREILASEPPIKATIGKTSIFEAGKDEQERGDVVKLSVTSDDLARINKKIAEAVPNKDTYPDYTPHITLAYVKAGEGKKYVGDDSLDGTEVTFDTLSFRGRSGEAIEIPLGGAVASPEPAQGDYNIEEAIDRVSGPRPPAMSVDEAMEQTVSETNKALEKIGSDKRVLPPEPDPSQTPATSEQVEGEAGSPQDIPPYRRHTTTNNVEREILREDMAAAREREREIDKRIEPLNTQLKGTRRNAYKKRGEIEKQISELRKKQGEFQEKQRVYGYKLDEMLLEDRLEKPKSYEHYLADYAELMSTRARLLNSSRERDSRGRVSDAGYEQVRELDEQAATYRRKLEEMARDIAFKDKRLTLDEINWAAERAAADFAGNSQGKLADEVQRKIAMIIEARVRRIPPSMKYLSDDEARGFEAELKQAAEGGQGWQKKADEITARAEKLNEERKKQADAEAKAESERKAKEAAKLALEMQKKKRAKVKEEAVEDRYWKSLASRASKEVTGTKGETEITIGDAKNEKRVKAKSIAVSDKYAIATYKDIEGDNKSETRLAHIPTGKAFAFGTEKQLKQLVLLMREADVPIDKVFNDDGSTNDDLIKLAVKVKSAWENDDLSKVPSELKAKLLSGIKPTETATKADMILDGDDLGLTDISQRRGFKGVATIKQIADAAPEFRYQPVFTVDSDKKLVFKDGVTYKLLPSALGLDDAEITVGQTVGINIEDLGIKPLTAPEVVVETLKQHGFKTVKIKPNGEIRAKFGLGEVAVSGKDEAWQAVPLGKSESLKKAHDMAVQALKKIHFYQETPAVKPKQETGERSPVAESPKAIGKMVSPTWTRESLAAKLREVAKSPEEADAVMALIEARASAIGMAAEEYANKRIRAIEKRSKGGVEQNREDTLAQPAYHGSPHRFDKFTLDRIGTGEGHQAYGWGLYFAGEKEVAKFYKEKLSEGATPTIEAIKEYFTPGRIVPSYGGKDKVLEFDENGGLGGGWRVKVQQVEDNQGNQVKDAQPRWHGTRPRPSNFQEVGVDPGVGRLYQVDLKPTDEELLHWDKPLSEQPKKVQDALGFDPSNKDRVNALYEKYKALEKEMSQYASLPDGQFFRAQWDDMARQKENLRNAMENRGAIVHNWVVEYQEPTGSSKYLDLARINGKEEASKRLLDLGIRGIKYLDGGSRGQGEGSYNYVIFDDADVVIEDILAQSDFRSGVDKATLAENRRAEVQLHRDGTNTIRVFEESQDLSSLVHEMGHVFLQDLPEADMAIVEPWAGVQDGKWTREAHEKFARGFERYLADGKAPTPELKSVFEKFKEWLRAIYKAIKDSPIDVKLTPDVRAVLDRMLTPKAIGKKAGAAEETPLAPSLHGPGLTPLAPSSTPVTIKSQREIINDIAKTFDVPIRFGRLTVRNAGGYWKAIQNLIGVRKANDVPVATHEAGHKFDTMFGFSSNKSIAAELEKLGDPNLPGSRSSWTKSKSKKYKRGEGMAEFMRKWLTQHEKLPQLRADYPNTNAAFEQVLNANKDLADKLRQIQEDVRLWRESEPEARLDSSIVSGGNPNGTRYTADQLMRDVVDDLHILRLAVDDAKKSGSLAPSRDPYIMARLLRGAYGMADTFIRTGVVDFKTKEVKPGTSLLDAIKPISGRLNEFRRYMVARRAKELHSQGRETGLQKRDVDHTYNKYHSDPDFKEAFQKVRNWHDALLRYSVDAGLVSKESAKAMREMNNDYVPFHRIFEIGAGETASQESGGAGRGLNLGKPGSLKRLGGSPRDIVDPLETAIKNAYLIVTASEKAAVHGAMADLANRKDMARWIREIAKPKEAVDVTVDQLREQLEDLGADLEGVDLDETLTFFRESRQLPYGENIVRVIKQGEPKYYQLDSGLFDTFHALDMDDAGKLITILSAPAQVLRAGATLDPDFMFRNFFRDTVGGAVINKYGALPIELTMRGVTALTKNPKLVAEWAAAGGSSAVEPVYFDHKEMRDFLVKQMKEKMTPLERAWVVQKAPLTALRWVSAKVEEATRIGEYEKAYKAHIAAGMPDGDARRLAAFESRDRQDFLKGGAKTKAVRRAVAFWNAGLQANVKIVEFAKNNPTRFTTQGLAYVTLPTLLLMAANWDDEDYWDQPRWKRLGFWLVRVGEDSTGKSRFLMIPKPFAIGGIFGALPEAMLGTWREKDPEAASEWAKTFLSENAGSLLPVPNTAGVVAELSAGEQGYNWFRDRQIIPDSIAQLPVEERWTEQTSGLAKTAGRLLGVAPMKVDHLIAQTTGGLGKIALGQKVPGKSLVTTPLVFSNQTTEDFYQAVEDLRHDKYRKEVRGELPGMEAVHLYALDKAMSRFRTLQKKARETADEQEAANYGEEAYQLAKEAMRRYREDDIDPQIAREFSVKQLSTSFREDGRPKQIARKDFKSDAEYQEKLSDYQNRLQQWTERRGAAEAWVRQYIDQPFMAEAVKEVVRKGMKKRPAGETQEEWKARDAKWTELRELAYK